LSGFLFAAACCICFLLFKFSHELFQFIDYWMTSNLFIHLLLDFSYNLIH
uniref:Ovule protein n=1 Tax=Brugia timori TaxID=42155 RepID=A0A0R3QFS5_9BILA